MIVRELSAPSLIHRLKCGGIYLHIGPFTIHIQSSIQRVGEGIGLLYADYPISLDCDFADFYVTVESPANLRRWIRPQVLFSFDGHTPFKPLPLEQAYPMLEWGLNWCVANHAHRYLIVHAAVVEKNGHAIIMPAPPGSGKSTLCAGLVGRGWRLLSDELALVARNELKLIPLPRPVSLKNKSIELIRTLVPDAVLSRPSADTVKGTVAHMKVPRDSVVRAHEMPTPGWIIFPKYQPDVSIQLEPVSKAHTLLRIAENSFNYSLLGLRGFETTADLVDACDCYSLTYSVLDEAVAVFDELVSPEVAASAVAHGR